LDEKPLHNLMVVGLANSKQKPTATRVPGTAQMPFSFSKLP
jgi:hypothetical protein